jgi:AbrB family looped-hinge helix DNA binding protein
MSTLSIDKAGRLVLPKPLRDRFRLRAGSHLEIEVHEDHLRLVPVEREPALVRRDGWWIHQGRPDGDVDLAEAVVRHRRERLEDLAR